MNGTNYGVTSTRHQSGNLGEVQGDAARNWQTYFSARAMSIDNADYADNYQEFKTLLSGPFFRISELSDSRVLWRTLDSFQNAHHTPKASYYEGRGIMHRYDFELARMTAAAEENRPANVAVKYIIKVK